MEGGGNSTATITKETTERAIGKSTSPTPFLLKNHLTLIQELESTWNNRWYQGGIDGLQFYSLSDHVFRFFLLGNEAHLLEATHRPARAPLCIRSPVNSSPHTQGTVNIINWGICPRGVELRAQQAGM